jgi:hypothetical protein
MAWKGEKWFTNAISNRQLGNKRGFFFPIVTEKKDLFYFLIAYSNLSWRR